ncbi:hypothetical protein C6P40_001331 [Pichia californica]|uniref:Uncharacterized protein n=1 Tax=Pichia californica TaxID=460514 RepID=A0A9P6WJ81_9ASCO|nr:hypothetical protein C6P42_001439 [[Candida] californica]KAG0688155.1 hypothetical protein C6P40_001331 [[Candida] californica]
MSSLEQSLDAIIAQNSKGKKPARRTIKGSKRPSIQSKSTVSKVRSNVRTRAPTVRGVAPRRSIQRPVAPASSQKVTRVSIQTASLDVATKVIVSGLPKDLDQKTIRVC